LRKHCKEYKKVDALAGRKFVAFERAGDETSEEEGRNVDNGRGNIETLR